MAYRADRARVRKLIPANRFLEVFVTAAASTREARDPKKLYTRAQQGALLNFTGVSAPYEAPEAPEMIIDTDRQSPNEAVEAVVAWLTASGVLR